MLKNSGTIKQQKNNTFKGMEQSGAIIINNNIKHHHKKMLSPIPSKIFQKPQMSWTI